MTDRDERTDRTKSAEEPARRDEGITNPPDDGIPPVNRDAQKPTDARPRGRTEEPDRTL
jgi:hypothetical protein